MPVHSLAPYVVLLVLLFLVLSVRTIRLRRRLGVAVGHGEHIALLRAMRAHANFAEYVPLALLLLYFDATTDAPAWFIHALGAALICGRLTHAYGVSRVDEVFFFRVFGMALTLSVIAIAAGWLALPLLPS